jgi:putative oxidoreductase
MNGFGLDHRSRAQSCLQVKADIVVSHVSALFISTDLIIRSDMEIAEMNDRFVDALKLVARVLMSASMIRYGAAKLVDIRVFTNNSTTINFMEIFAGGMPAPLWFAYANAVFQTGAAICVLVGFHTRIAAGLLAIWLCVLTLVGHPFWTMDPDSAVQHESLFYRNLAMIAADLLIAAVGAGRYAVDRRVAGKY